MLLKKALATSGSISMAKFCLETMALFRATTRSFSQPAKDFSTLYIIVNRNYFGSLEISFGIGRYCSTLSLSEMKPMRSFTAKCSYCGQEMWEILSAFRYFLAPLMRSLR